MTPDILNQSGEHCVEGERFRSSCAPSQAVRRAYRADLLRLGSRPLPGSLRELYYRRAACDGGGRGNLRSAGVDCQSIPARPR
jgi:hypothetical protein